MIIQNVPFFSNTKDNTHCYQAVLKMILKFFEPKQDFSWALLDKLSAKIEGKGTWPTQGYINFHKRGYELIFMEDFDYHRFINLGEKYLYEKYGSEMAKEQIKMSDIKQEQKIMKQFVEIFLTKTKLPGLDDIKIFLSKGYLIVCNVNYWSLYQKKGYSGHFVLVYGIDEKYIHLHDPGLPPNSHATISKNNFMKAWAYPNSKSKNLCAYKLTNSD